MGNGLTAECAKASGQRHSIHIEAVQRRRDARRLAKKQRQRQEEIKLESKWEAKRQKEREAAQRMTRRWYPSDGSGVGNMPHPVCLDYRFWQAMRCGINLLAPIFWDGKCDVWADGSAWRWWVDLHYETRDDFVNRFGSRLVR